MSRVLRWTPFFLGAVLIAGFTLPAGRVPGGDAPHILSIAHRLAAELQAGAWTDFYIHLGSLVTPHPPAGYLVPTGLALLGLGPAIPVVTSLIGLALCWHGLILLRRDDEIAAQGHLEPATDGIPVHGGDDRFVAAVEDVHR